MADELIAEYFKVWKQDLSKTEKLLNQDEYYLEAILVLSCYVGALASLRYPQLKDNKSYKKLYCNIQAKKIFMKK